MQERLPAVESKYGVDCTQLKTSIAVACRELDVYLDAEEKAASASSAVSGGVVIPFTLSHLTSMLALLGAEASV